MALTPQIIVSDTVTKSGPDYRGAVLVSGSHGGVYAAFLAAKTGVRAVILNDAGVGKDDAGIAGLAWLADLGIPAATVSHQSARIADGNDMISRGVISHVNAAAARLGLRPEMRCEVAAELLQARAPEIEAEVPDYGESRFLIEERGGVRAWAMDSASLAGPEDAGEVLVMASHGALLGGETQNALKADAFAAVFHDAGIGIDRAGVSRVIALDERGIIAAAVGHDSARIGDGQSLVETGVISFVNHAAENAGFAPGISVREFVSRSLEMARQQKEEGG